MLVTDCREGASNREDVFSAHVAKRGFDGFSPECMATVLRLTEKMKGGGVQRYSIPDLEHHLRELLAAASFKYVAIGRSYEQVWWRARRLESAKAFGNLKELIYPQNPAPNFGRASYPHQRVLYASWNMPTAVSEVGGSPGDFVQVIACRVRPGFNMPCFMFGAYERHHACGRDLIGLPELESYLEEMIKASTPEDQIRRVYVDALIAELFRSLRQQSGHEYEWTSAAANLVFSSEVFGLMYPSVKSTWAVNLAVPDQIFDHVFEVVEVWVVEIVESYGYGLYAIRPRALAHVFADDGEILWDRHDPDFAPSFDRKTGMQLSERFTGWRVNKNTPEHVPLGDWARINEKDDYDRRFWARKLGTTEQKVVSAVAKVGPVVNVVRGWLSSE